MAAETRLQPILATFASSADSAAQALPPATSIIPPEQGISLLDAQNDIFLAYLQALALRNLNVIRSLRDGVSVDDVQRLSDGITEKLLEHRVYLERGVRPLEQKIKYQLDKVVKAANDDERITAQREKQAPVVNGNGDAESESGSDSSGAEESEEVDATSHRPNFAGLTRAHSSAAEQSRKDRSISDAVYRPPRVSATAMPTTSQREPKPQRAARSATIDEYVRNELSTAPLAQPSIGSTIAAGGRRTKDAAQLAREQERRDYEETHLMRLPPESRKERAKQSARKRNGGFGGEEFRGLTDSVERIADLTKRRQDSALERSRKRPRREVEDGPRNDGTMGSAFDVKKRRVMKKMKR
jgi:U3 small nucleolar ribonucleoprotein protein LCP5